jgi:hypothetical protein
LRPDDGNRHPGLLLLLHRKRDENARQHRPVHMILRPMTRKTNFRSMIHMWRALLTDLIRSCQQIHRLSKYRSRPKVWELGMLLSLLTTRPKLPK